MKAEEVYVEIAARIQQLTEAGMSMENWTSVCSLLAKGSKIAAIAKEEDISILPFYRMGLKYLRQAPKEMSIERALETLDDSDEFYSFDEQLVVVKAFAWFASRLEEWAEAMDLHHGIYWRVREGTRPWHRVNPEDYDEDDKPPYYGWVLVNINGIKNNFSPPLDPYDTELNNNPFWEELFVYQSTRQGWRFYPKIIEVLLSQMSEAPTENPFVGKFLEWGAESVDAIPSSLLKIKDGLVSKELFEKNLHVKDEDYLGLFKRLNGNVDAYNKEQEVKLRDSLNECMSGVMYDGKEPVDVLNEKLEQIDDGLIEDKIIDDCAWQLLLATALHLPRYNIYYFDWAQRYPEDGPEEPGLVYSLINGTKQQVHYDIRQSKWWDGIDKVEWRGQRIIDKCQNLAKRIRADAILNQWYDIETSWKKCQRDSESSYHCTGDLSGFASAFCDDR